MDAYNTIMNLTKEKEEYMQKFDNAVEKTVRDSVMEAVSTCKQVFKKITLRSIDSSHYDELFEFTVIFEYDYLNPLEIVFKNTNIYNEVTLVGFGTFDIDGKLVVPSEILAFLNKCEFNKVISNIADKFFEGYHKNFQFVSKN